MNDREDAAHNLSHHEQKATEENEPVFSFNTRELGRIIVSNSASSSSAASGVVAAAGEGEEDDRRGERMATSASFDYLVMLNYTLSKCTRKLWSLCTCIVAIYITLVAHVCLIDCVALIHWATSAR